MCSTAKDGRHLANLVVDAAALCRAAQRSLPVRTRPGRPDTFEQWQIAVLIFVAILHGRKSKSAQYRFLLAHQSQLLGLASLRLETLPSRATYMRRYGDVYPLYEKAIELGGQKAIKDGIVHATTVAADKSMIRAPGCEGSQQCCRRRFNADPEAGWGRSTHDGWTWGYCYEVVVCAGKHELVLPLLASADKANRSEYRSFPEKIPHLPEQVRNVLVDKGYDGNELAEAIEYTREGKRTHRHLICPMLARAGNPAVGVTIHKGRRERLRRHRLERERFFRSRRGRRLYRRRMQSVEPFNQWFKSLFGLEDRVWHRGLNNNRTMLLACLFCYQTLQRYNAARGNAHGQIRWLLDSL